jgi:hypothetical protein
MRMPNPAAQLIVKWDEPSVVSIIFAPRPANESLSASEPRWDRDIVSTLTNASPTYLDIAKSLTAAFQLELVLVYQHVYQTLARAQGAAFRQVSSAEAPLPVAMVPPRKFPFASHLDLVSGTIEGLEFDADDYRTD